MKANAERTGWSRRYRAALRRHLRPGPRSNEIPAAAALGVQAEALGMEPLDVARIHEAAMAKGDPTVTAPGARRKQLEKARRFFTETLVPIEEKHRAARKASLHVEQLTRTVRARSEESSASIRLLAQGIAQRKAAEKALKESRVSRTQLLKESRQLQIHLREQVQEIMAAQEDERLQASRQLHEHIAQTLVAIHLRLLTLKSSAKASTESLKKEIAKTQRLVKQSVRKIKQFVHEDAIQHEA